MNKAEIMRLADGYAIAVAQAPHSPRPLAKKLAEQRIEKARDSLVAALEQPEQQAEPCQYCGLSECDPKCMWIEQAPQQQAEPVAWEHHAKKLTHWLHCMSYNDSYFGEPAGLVKQVTAELNRLIGTALRSALEQPERQAEPVHGDIRALKYRIHELEGEVMGYKRMLDVAEAASQPQQQAEPVAHKRMNDEAG